MCRLCPKQSKGATAIPSTGKSLDEVVQRGRTREPNDEGVCPRLDPKQMGNCEFKAGGELGSMMEGAGVRAIMKGNDVS